MCSLLYWINLYDFVTLNMFLALSQQNDPITAMEAALLSNTWCKIGTLKMKREEPEARRLTDFMAKSGVPMPNPRVQNSGPSVC